MSKTPMFDKKMKTLLANVKLGERTCPYSLERWTLDADYLERCRKWNVPPSDLAPTMRLRELTGWGAGIDLWWKPHFLTGKPMITGLHPDTIVPVIQDDEWHAKDWGEEKRKDYDPSSSFFEQIEPLFRSVPYPALSTHACTNVMGCGIVNCTNCYMSFGTFGSKDCWFTARTTDSDRCMDTLFVVGSERVFSSAKSGNCVNGMQLFQSFQCLNSDFLFDSGDCEDCFCSTNLRHKRYVFMNEQLTPQEYRARRASIDLSCTSVFEKWCREFQQVVREQAVWPPFFNAIGCTNVQGDAMNCLDCDGFFMIDSRRVKDGWFVFGCEDVETVVSAKNSQNVYYSYAPIGVQDMKFSFIADYSHAVEYCMNCRNLEYCFGCVGLQRKKFCIFNKPYAEGEYWKRVDALKCAMLERGEYGRFFPPSFSALSMKFGFSYLIAPFSSEELLRMGAPDLDAQEGMRFAPYKKEVTFSNPAQAPDCVREAQDDWTGVEFFDEGMQRRYSVLKPELEFRKAHGYPFPRRHYTHRLKELAQQVNMPQRETRACGKCATEVLCAKNAMFPERNVYCQSCYQTFIASR